jgi:hypothetical protein
MDIITYNIFLFEIFWRKLPNIKIDMKFVKSLIECELLIKENVNFVTSIEVKNYRYYEIYN